MVALQMLARWALGPMFGLFLPWTAGLAGVLLIAFTFFGAAVASRDREHVAIDLAIDHLPKTPSRILIVVRSLLVIGFIILLIQGSLRMYNLTLGRALGAIPTVPFLTNEWLYLYVMSGGLLMIIYVMRDIVAVLRDESAQELLGEINE